MMKHTLQLIPVFLLAALPAVPCAAAAAKPLKVFILAGQSNMEGPAHIRTTEGIGDDPVTAPMLKDMLGHVGFIGGTMQQIIAISQMPNQ